MIVGKSIQIALVKQDMTRADLVSKAKVTNSYLSRVIKNQVSPTIVTVERLASAFDMSVSEFIALGE